MIPTPMRTATPLVLTFTSRSPRMKHADHRLVFGLSCCSSYVLQQSYPLPRQALLHISYASSSSLTTRAKIQSTPRASDRVSPESNLPGRLGR